MGGREERFLTKGYKTSTLVWIDRQGPNKEGIGKNTKNGIMTLVAVVVPKKTRIVRKVKELVDNTIHTDASLVNGYGSGRTLGRQAWSSIYSFDRDTASTFESSLLRQFYPSPVALVRMNTA